MFHTAQDINFIIDLRTIVKKDVVPGQLTNLLSGSGF